MRVAFSNFWNGFAQTDNLFLELLSEEYEGVVVVKSDVRSKIDLELSSVFTPKSRYILKKVRSLVKEPAPSFINDKDFYRSSQFLKVNPLAARRIWYTGENIRPPLDPRFSSFLSFDQDSYSGTNAYLPLWQLYFRHQMSTYDSPQIGNPISVGQFLEGRSVGVAPKKFVCAFIGNVDPRRMRAIEALREFGEVDIYGKRFGKFVTEKTKVAKEYRFVLSFENDHYPGYVTEKLFDAYASGSIPLYWGSLGNQDIVNMKSFIDAGNFENLATFASHVGQLSTESWQKIYQQPLLHKLPNFSPVRQILNGKTETLRN